MKRRERTRQLIELGGLVAKAGLIELADDDRAVIFGVLVEAAARLRGDDREAALMLWRRRGKRAFNDDHEGRAAVANEVVTRKWGNSSDGTVSRRSSFGLDFDKADIEGATMDGGNQPCQRGDQPG